MQASDSERITKLIADTVSMLCKNSVHFTSDLKIQGLIGVTSDSTNIFLIPISEIFEANDDHQASHEATKRERVPVRRRLAMPSGPPPRKIMALMAPNTDDASTSNLGAMKNCPTGVTTPSKNPSNSVPLQFRTPRAMLALPAPDCMAPRALSVPQRRPFAARFQRPNAPFQSRTPTAAVRGQMMHKTQMGSRQMAPGRQNASIRGRMRGGLLQRAAGIRTVRPVRQTIRPVRKVNSGVPSRALPSPIVMPAPQTLAASPLVKGRGGHQSTRILSSSETQRQMMLRMQGPRSDASVFQGTSPGMSLQLQSLSPRIVSQPSPRLKDNQIQPTTSSSCQTLRFLQSPVRPALPAPPYQSSVAVPQKTERLNRMPVSTVLSSLSPRISTCPQPGSLMPRIAPMTSVRTLAPRTAEAGNQRMLIMAQSPMHTNVLQSNMIRSPASGNQALMLSSALQVAEINSFQKSQSLQTTPALSLKVSSPRQAEQFATRQNNLSAGNQTPGFQVKLVGVLSQENMEKLSTSNVVGQLPATGAAVNISNVADKQTPSKTPFGTEIRFLGSTACKEAPTNLPFGTEIRFLGSSASKGAPTSMPVGTEIRFLGSSAGKEASSLLCSVASDVPVKLIEAAKLTLHHSVVPGAYPASSAVMSQSTIAISKSPLRFIPASPLQMANLTGPSSPKIMSPGLMRSQMVQSFTATGALLQTTMAEGHATSQVVSAASFLQPINKPSSMLANIQAVAPRAQIALPASIDTGPLSPQGMRRMVKIEGGGGGRFGGGESGLKIQTHQEMVRHGQPSMLVSCGQVAVLQQAAGSVPSFPTQKVLPAPVSQSGPNIESLQQFKLCGNQSQLVVKQSTTVANFPGISRPQPGTEGLSSPQSHSVLQQFPTGWPVAERPGIFLGSENSSNLVQNQHKALSIGQGQQTQNLIQSQHLQPASQSQPGQQRLAQNHSHLQRDQLSEQNLQPGTPGRQTYLLPSSQLKYQSQLQQQSGAINSASLGTQQNFIVLSSGNTNLDVQNSCLSGQKQSFTVATDGQSSMPDSVAAAGASHLFLENQNLRHIQPGALPFIISRLPGTLTQPPTQPNTNPKPPQSHHTFTQHTGTLTPSHSQQTLTSNTTQGLQKESYNSCQAQLTAALDQLQRQQALKEAQTAIVRQNQPILRTKSASDSRGFAVDSSECQQLPIPGQNLKSFSQNILHYQPDKLPALLEAQLSECYLKDVVVPSDIHDELCLGSQVVAESCPSSEASTERGFTVRDTGNKNLENKTGVLFSTDSCVKKPQSDEFDLDAFAFSQVQKLVEMRQKDKAEPEEATVSSVSLKAETTESNTSLAEGNESNPFVQFKSKPFPEKKLMLPRIMKSSNSNQKGIQLQGLPGKEIGEVSPSSTICYSEPESPLRLDESDLDEIEKNLSNLRQPFMLFDEESIYHYHCRYHGCRFTSDSDTDFASHYTEMHTDNISLEPGVDDQQYLPLLTASGPNSSSDQPGDFPCPYAGCDRAFSTLTGVCNHHVKAHRITLNKKQKTAIMSKCGQLHHCSVCLRGFASKSGLMQHIAKTRHGK